MAKPQQGARKPATKYAHLRKKMLGAQQSRGGKELGRGPGKRP